MYNVTGLKTQEINAETVNEWKEMDQKWRVKMSWPKMSWKKRIKSRKWDFTSNTKLTFILLAFILLISVCLVVEMSLSCKSMHEGIIL